MNDLFDLVSLPYSLPSLEIAVSKDEIERSRPKTQPTTKLETKVVTNAGFLMQPSDTPGDVLRKLAACVADAGGLGVDFRGL